MKSIPCVLMRGGSSRGPFFLKEWLPNNEIERNEILLQVMGTPHELQLNGLGGGNSLTSKVAIVSKSSEVDCDVDYLFAQVHITKKIVDTKPNCGNMLAGVGPFSIEQGLVPVTGNVTTVRVFNVNTKSKIDLLVSTPNGVVQYEGDTTIDGVNGSAAPVYLKFKEVLGGVTGNVFPTGEKQEVILDMPVTCIDAAQLMVLIDAEKMGVTGVETAEELDANEELLELIEKIRLEAGLRMGLGDVSESVLPKPVLVKKDKNSNKIISRYFTPAKCHKSHAATGAVGLGIAACIEGTLIFDMQTLHFKKNQFEILHPQGAIPVAIELNHAGMDKDFGVLNASIVRTARKIMEGKVYVN